MRLPGDDHTIDRWIPCGVEVTSGKGRAMGSPPYVMDRVGGRARIEARPPVDLYAPFRLIDGERWYVVHIQPHREIRAYTHLAAQGFLTFLPRHAKTVRHACKLSTLSAACFFPYLFVALDLSRNRWPSVNETFAVTRLVMAEELPTPVPAGVVDGLSAACSVDGHLHLDPALAPGDRVRVLTGPFADLLGEFVRIDDTGRLTVPLWLLGGEVPVSIPRATLMAARAA